MQDLHINPFLTERMPVCSAYGMVVTSQPLAAQAGLEILKKGGNAIDAAVAAAASLTVLEPTSNGIGSDAFAIVWYRGKMYGINGSGPAPMGISISRLKEKGLQQMPVYGWLPVTVPGAPATWAAFSERFGRLPFAQVMGPACYYANEGFPISPVVARNWATYFKKYQQELKGENFRPWFDTFAPNGHPPKSRELWRSPAHGKTMEAIARSGSREFYEGDLADCMVQESIKAGGYLRREDLAQYQVQWVDPLKVEYRGYEVWELPPNGQGLITLHALNILKGFEPFRFSQEAVHRQIEAVKLAFADGLSFITDPDMMTVNPKEILADVYAITRRSLIHDNALLPGAARPQPGGTVYLAAADREGNMVSMIQSNFMGFGSGIVIPGTGISLQNRGQLFSLDPNNVNALCPGKRTFHTIMPGFLSKSGVPVGPFGVMGDYMQPQRHVQLVCHLVDQHLHPQSALDAPRWRWVKEERVAVEPHFPAHLTQSLIDRGHQVEVSLQVKDFGRGQVIWRNHEGIFIGGSDSRADGFVAAW